MTSTIRFVCSPSTHGAHLYCHEQLWGFWRIKYCIETSRPDFSSAYKIYKIALLLPANSNGCNRGKIDDF